MKIRLATSDDCNAILEGQKKAYNLIKHKNPSALKETIEEIENRLNSVEWLLYVGTENNSIVSSISYCLSYVTNSAYSCHLFSNKKNAGKTIFNETINNEELKELGIEKVFLKTFNDPIYIRFYKMQKCRNATQAEAKECEERFSHRISSSKNNVFYLMYDLIK